MGILDSLSKNPSVLALAALGIGLFLFRDKISDFFSTITGGAEAAAQAGDITNTALETLAGNQQGLLDSLNTLTNSFQNSFNFLGNLINQPQQPPPESFTPPVPTDEIIVAPEDIGNCECGGSLQNQFGINFVVCNECSSQLPQQPPIQPTSLNDFANLFNQQQQENFNVQSQLNTGQQFQGGGVSFIGGFIGETPIANLSLGQIITKFQVTASQAANILAQAQDNLGDFDFGTNTGSGIGSVTASNPLLNTQLPNEGQVSDQQFAGLSAQQIALMLTGGNISNF